MAVRYEPFAPAHLATILGLCETQGWPSLPADPARAQRALTAPGVTTVVAVDADEVIGFATFLSDGQIDSYLSALLVAAPRRREGVGEALLSIGYQWTGATRVDLLAGTGAEAFYARIPHRRFAGFRLQLEPDGPAATTGATP